MNPIDVNLRQFQAFITVARLNSFTRAAALLHISQPALTKQVLQLEEVLGARLFDRNTRKVELTQIGKELAPVINQILAQIEGAVFNTQELAAKNRGIIRVAALPSICSTILPRAIAIFRETHPGISVVFQDVVAQRLLALVRAEEVDFGIGSLTARDMDVRFSVLLSDRMVVAFPRGHALQKVKAVRLKDLAGQPLVLMAGESSVRKLVDEAFASIGAWIAPAFEATYMSTAAGIVKAGLALAILPSSALEMGELVGLSTRPITRPVITREIGVIEKPGRSLSPAAEVFLQGMVAFLDSQPKAR
jgi:DNA-binding transcriptional LysR family regulator